MIHVAENSSLSAHTQPPEDSFPKFIAINVLRINATLAWGKLKNWHEKKLDGSGWISEGHHLLEAPSTHTDQQQHSSEESLGLSGLQPEGEQSSDISRALLGRSERSAPYEFRGDLKSAFPNCSIHTTGIFINCHKKAGLACPHLWLKTTYSPPQMTRSTGTSLARKLTLIFDITTQLRTY